MGNPGRVVTYVLIGLEAFGDFKVIVKYTFVIG
jgi:hypothetical protein